MRNAGVSLPQQAFALRSVYPDGTVRLGPSSLLWRGRLKPSGLAEQYLTEVSLQMSHQPVVNVIEPVLKPDGQGRLPHIWEDGSLCLNTAGQWTTNMLLVDTVVPWAAEWLFHYEIWLGAGVWFGDGALAERPEAQAQLLHPLNEMHNVQGRATH